MRTLAGLNPLSSERMEGWCDWTNLASEILALVIHKVQQRAASDNDEMRRLVAMAGVCRSWRLVVQSFLSFHPFCSTGLLQFPCSLREAGPRDKPMQCVLRRRGGTFFLYQSDCGSGQEMRESKSNFLIGACKRWRPGHIMFVISSDRRSFSRKSSGFMGKLRSNFLGNAFVLWDYQNPNKARPVSFARFTEEVVDGVGQRKMTCVVRSPRTKKSSSSSSRAIIGGCRSVSHHGVMTACFSPLASKTFGKWSCMSNLQNSIRSMAYTPRGYHSLRDEISRTRMEERAHYHSRAMDDSPNSVDHFQRKLKLGGGRVVPGLLKNGEKVAMFTSKIPEWDVERQCWSLNFHGRATLPSMHNFQLLLPPPDERLGREGTRGERRHHHHHSSDLRQKMVVMQVGKIAKGLYALEFRYPLSAFQAFNIALSSFATTVRVEP